MKIKRIFLDNYEFCKRQEADLVIIPQSNDEGVKAPELYYKRKDPHWLVTKIDGDTVWSSDMRVSITTNQDDYNQCVEWWFNNISEEYQQQLLGIADAAIAIGFDISISVEKALNKLKLADKQHRKSNLGRYLLDWVSTGCSRYILKQKSNGVY